MSSDQSAAKESIPPWTCPFTTGFDPPSPSSTTQSSPVAATPGNNAVSTPASIPRAVLESLPTFFHDRDEMKTIIQPQKEVQGFFTKDLDLERLNKIHGYLWMCGRPFNGRSLHRHVVMSRRVVATEQMDLHLLYYSGILLVKPLPAYILCKEVWENYLSRDKELRESAVGFLLSYIWLVRSPMDFRLAMDKNNEILPYGLEWADWRRIVDETLTNIDADTLYGINKRYQFGELRLSRINSIYRIRFCFDHFVRGYLYGYNRYVPFFKRNVAWILAFSVLLSLVLSAMQVGVAVDPLMANHEFLRATYGFVVFSIVLVAAVLAFVTSIFVFVFLHNMVAAILHSNRMQQRRKKEAEKKHKSP